MKLSTRRDIDAPAPAVFDALADFARHEARIRAGGARVERLDDGARPGAAAWRIDAPIGGVRRNVEARLTRFERPREIALRAASDGITALVEVGVTALGPDRSRLTARVDLRGETLASRLLLHSLKVARGSLETRLARWVDGLAAPLAHPAAPET